MSLAGPEARHLATVLRLKEGDQVELFDGAGMTAHAAIKTLKPGQVDLLVDEVVLAKTRDKGRIVIAVSIAKGDRFDGLLAKCSELGVDHICPVIFERTVKKSQGENIMARYKKLVIAAAKQSERLFFPVIKPPSELSQLVNYLKQTYPFAQWLVGDRNEQAEPLVNHPWSGQDVIAFIGPEGGLTDGEKALLDSFQAGTTCLASTILRIETAAIAFASILSAQRFSAEKDMGYHP